MKKTFIAGLATGLLTLGISGTANAASFTFDGNIQYHNDVIEIAFSLATAATNVKVWTDSFMSGANFDPITAVWVQNGSDYSLIDENDDDDSIATNQTWYDSGLIFSTLAAGNYLFTIAAYNNWSVGSLLSAGFTFDNQTPIALSNWNQPANGTDMGTYYKVNLDGVDAAQNNTDPVPEPATMLLFGTGLAGLAAASRRKVQK